MYRFLRVWNSEGLMYASLTHYVSCMVMTKWCAHSSRESQEFLDEKHRCCQMQDRPG